MLIVCCTTKLLKRLRTPAAPAPPAPGTRLGDWYATVLQVRPQHLVLLVNEPTRLAAVLLAREFATLGQRIPVAIARVLEDLGVDAAVVDHERRAMAEVTFTKTVSRSVRGTMNELAFQLEHLRESNPRQPRSALRNLPLEGGWHLLHTHCTFFRDRRPLPRRSIPVT